MYDFNFHPKPEMHHFYFCVFANLTLEFCCASTGNGLKRFALNNSPVFYICSLIWGRTFPKLRKEILGNVFLANSSKSPKKFFPTMLKHIMPSKGPF